MRVPRVLRRVEIALLLIGLALLSGALGATYDRWRYQRQQERALFEPAVQEPAARVRTGTFGPFPPSAADPRESAGPLSKSGSMPERRVASERPSAGADPYALGRIEIPRLGLAAIVREGADEKTLARAVGLVPGTARPGQNGNVVLAGHRDTFFRPLRGIRVNDRIRLFVPPHQYEYRVESLRVVTPEETDALASRGVDELTLVTCYPFRFIGPAPDRFIVSAARVN